jgi:hypothetical protein
MPERFRVLLPVVLDLEVVANDAVEAVAALDEAFKRADPLGTPRVKFPRGVRVTGWVLDATSSGSASVKKTPEDPLGARRRKAGMSGISPGGTLSGSNRARIRSV